MSSRRSLEPFTKDPPDKLTEAQLLSYLLNYCESTPSETAKLLLSHFGSLANLLDATSEELATEETLSHQGISLLRLVSELHRRYLLIRSQTEVRLLDHTSIANYLSPLFVGAKEETVYLLTLDSARRVLGCTQLSHGGPDCASVPLRALVQEALMKKASYVVIAHNHPSGVRAPSPEDIQSTLALTELLHPLDILLLDHLIFTDWGYCSLAECGYCRN